MMNNALISQNPNWTRADFFQRAAQIAQQFQQEQIKTIGLFCEDASQFACVLVACVQANVNILLPPHLLEEDKHWVTQNADFLFDDALFAQYAVSQKFEKILPLVWEKSQTQIYLKTSGSSGSAKIVRKTAQQMWAEANALAETLPLNIDNLQVLGSVSVQHLYGLTFRIMLPLVKGWQIGRFQQQYPEFLIAESRHQPSLWIASPALLTHLNLQGQAWKDLPLKGIISAGSALPEKVADDLHQHFSCPIIEIYGSTETGVIASRWQSLQWHTFPSVQIGTNEQGALWVCSAWIDGQEQTADSVEIEGNHFRLLGRIDRIIKLGDKRISLARIENALLSHSWVTDCYIALHPQQHRPAAWVALSAEGMQVLAQQGRKHIMDQLRRHLRQTQEKLALPRFWRFTEQLPRNSQAKISRADFEQIWQQGEK